MVLSKRLLPRPESLQNTAAKVSHWKGGRGKEREAPDPHASIAFLTFFGTLSPVTTRPAFPGPASFQHPYPRRGSNHTRGPSYVGNGNVEPASPPPRGHTAGHRARRGPERAILPLPPGTRDQHACFQPAAAQKDHPGHLGKPLRPGSCPTQQTRSAGVQSSPVGSNAEPNSRTTGPYFSKADHSHSLVWVLRTSLYHHDAVQTSI